MKTCIKIVFLLGCTISGFAQITFNGCHILFDNQNFIFTEVGTDVTGRNIFETIPINEDQPCSGVGICEFRISWNNTESRWEFIADDGDGGFLTPFLIYSNSEPSTPNPPSLNLGTWVENAGITNGDCAGDLTTANATLTGDVQDTTLGIDGLLLDNQIGLYPNPATHILHLNTKGKNIDRVLIYNTLGELVLQDKGSNTIAVSQYHSGVYFVKIQIDNREFIKKLIIK